MKTLNTILAFIAAMAMTSCSAQDLSRVSGIKNAQQVTVKIDGDCPMCEKTIETTGTVKGEALVDWDVDAKTAKITYDSARTDLDAILKRIAYAGYDNERYLAPQQAYDALPSCCQYMRTLKHDPIMNEEHAHDHGHSDHASSTRAHSDQGSHDSQIVDQEMKDHLDPVFNSYFTLKDALVASDQKASAEAASTLAAAIDEVPMAELDHEVHMVWMKVLDPLKQHANAIASSTDLEEQRKTFKALSEHMIELAKAADHESVIHLQHCPMYEGGSDWLSREKEIRNPYYGSKMLTCGSVKETIE
jgi:copper chaperone CopZ